MVIGLGTLAVPLDSMVNVAFPDIVRDFGLPIPMIQWVVICYVLTHASLMLVFGRLGDMVGHRRIFMIGAGFSAVAFALCALAPGYGWLLAARVAQGIGAALLLSCGTALATFLFPEAQRTRALGLYTMVFGLGGALGPPLAGLLVDIWGWRAVFAVRVPICLLALFLAFLLPAHRPTGARESFDALGALWLALSVTAALLAVNQLAEFAQRAWLSVGLGLVTLLAMVAFIRQEKIVARPIIDLALFRDVDFSLVNLGHVLVNLSAFAVLLLVPFYLSQIVGLPVVAMGLVLSASPLGLIVAAPLAGRLAGVVPARLLITVGALAVSIALGTIALAHQFGIVVMMAAMALQGMGMGLYQVGQADIVTRALPLRARGVAGSLSMMTRTLGTVGGASVLMFAFQTWRSGPGLDETEAFLVGFRVTFLLAAGIAGVVGLVLLWRRKVVEWHPPSDSGP